MELTNKKNDDVFYFTIISGDDTTILDVIHKYNKIYKTDFSVEGFSYDEVIFVKISVSEYKVEDIFNLGYNFGYVVKDLQMRGEIDW